MSGILKSVAALVIVVLAALAIAVVFGLIDLSALGQYAGRVVLVGCIVAIASGALAMLLGRRD